MSDLSDTASFGTAERLDARALLDLWERAAGVAASWRDDALLASADAPAPKGLGERNAALLRLRARCFGAMQTLRCACPRCRETAEFTIDCEALADSLRPMLRSTAAHAVDALHRFDMQGWRVDFRMPDADDLRALTASNRESDASIDFASALSRRCILGITREDGTPCALQDLPEAVADALSRHMESLDPGASVEFALACPACDARWSAAIDIGAVLWSELQSHAKGLLAEVAVLARHCGWSERDILALTPARRAAYLQLAGAGA